MSFTVIVLLIIILYCIYLYAKYRYKQYKNKVNSTLYIQPTIELGNIVIKEIKNNQRLPEVGSADFKYIERVPEKLAKPIKKENREKNKILALVSGKYFIKDKKTLDYLSDLLDKTDQDKNTMVKSSGGYENFEKKLLICCRALFPIEKDPLKKMLIGQYIAKHTDKNREIFDVYDYILDIASDIGNHPDIRMNAVDILLQSNNNKYKIPANKVLESIRIIGDTRRNNEIITPIEDMQLQQGLINDIQLYKAQKFVQAKKDVPRTVFEDSQNVHNTGINESVLNLAHELVKQHNPAPNILEFDYDLIKDFSPERRAVIEKSLHRIMTDSSTFRHDTNLYIIFQSLLNYIKALNEPLKKSVNQRLVEELQEMSGLCVTGHLTRLLNVVQGFDGVSDNLKMKISLDDEIYATMKNHFDKILANDEDLMDDMMTEEKRLLSERLKNESNKLVLQISSSYPVDRKDDVIESMVKSLNKYLGKNFTKF